MREDTLVSATGQTEIIRELYHSCIVIDCINHNALFLFSFHLTHVCVTSVLQSGLDLVRRLSTPQEVLPPPREGYASFY
jgi:hypothetical protein